MNEIIKQTSDIQNVAGETRQVSSLELAEQFYLAHRLDFQRAAKAEETLERGFEYSAEQFDDWAVTAGHMARRADDCDEIDRHGATNERHKLRSRINRVARRGAGLDRAFSIEASHKKDEGWRVVLGERFLAERPLGIMQGIGTNLHSQENNIAATRAAGERDTSDPA